MGTKKGGHAAAFTVADVIAAMEDWAPPVYAYEWDRIGLAVGDPQAAVSRVFCCLSVTDQVLQEAAEWGAQLVVSHHPLIWEPLRALREDAAHTRLCLEFVRRGIACFSAHTNLDLAPGGVNDVLAEQIGLQDTQPLLPVKLPGQLKLLTFVPETHLRLVRDALAEAGAGIIGNYTHCSFFGPGTGTFLPNEAAAPFSGDKGVINEEPELRLEMLVPRARLAQVLGALRATHPYEEPAFDLVPLESSQAIGLGRLGRLPKPLELADFAEKIAVDLLCGEVRLVGPPNHLVQQIAVIGGSGGDFVAEVGGRADVLVTGDVKYHQAWDAQERGLAIIDAGHGATEKAIAPVIADYLLKRMPGLETKSLLEREIFQTIRMKGGR